MTMMNRKYRICLIALMAFVTMLLAGCGNSMAEKAEMRKYEATATDNAIKYVQKKYGFEAEVKDTQLEKADPGCVPQFKFVPTGYAYVKVLTEDKEFNVYITGEEESTEGYDDYQSQLITDAFLSYVKKSTGVSPKAATIRYGRDNQDATITNLTEYYYDGTNFDDILQKESFSGVLEYVDGIQLSQLNTYHAMDSLRQTADVDLLLVKYRSQDAFEKVPTHIYNLDGTPVEFESDDYAVYMQEKLVVTTQEVNYESFALTESGPFSYFTKNHENVLMRKTKPMDITNLSGYGEGDGIKSLSDTFTIETEADTVYIYVPAAIVKSAGTDADVKIALQYNYADGSSEYLSQTVDYEQVVSDYLFTVNLKDHRDVAFTVIAD